MPNHKLQFPKSADNVINELTTELVAAVAKVMLADGESASAIAYMRRDVLITVSEYYPYVGALTSRGPAS
jgi:hypothetical protein